MWRAYNCVTELIFSHDTVNHSHTFVSPTGFHTNTIMAYWSKHKMPLRSMHGIPENSLNRVLAEVMFKEICINIFWDILSEIGMNNHIYVS